MRGKKHINIIIIWIWGIVTIISLIVGIYIFNIYQNNFQSDEANTEYKKYFVMITDDRKSSFWQSVYQGMDEAAKEENIYVELLGENLTEDYTKIDLMQIAIASDVDGIVVEADESSEMTEVINEAVEQGIAVVTVYGDNTHSNRCSFVGIGSYNLGKEYGSQVLKLAEGKDKVNVTVLVNTNKSDSSQSILCSGIKEVIEKEKNSDSEIELNLVSIDDTNVFSTEEFIRNIFMNYKLPDIFICLDELKTTCVYQAMVDYNRVGQVGILGYYDSETILNAIDRNVIAATISVETKQMGRYCLEALEDYLQYGNTNQYYMADVTLIDKSNVADYIGGEDENKAP